MATGSTLNSWHLWLATYLLDTFTFRVVLTNGLTLSKATTKAAIAAAELLQANGYSRKAVTWGSDPTFNATTQRVETPATSITETASGAALQWDTAILWLEADATSSLQVSAIDTTTDRLTITAHGRTDGDEVTVTSAVALAGGLTADTLYYLKSIDANTIELYSDSGLTTKINLTSTGTGTHYLRLCNGQPIGYVAFTPQTINDGQTQTVQITGWNFLNTGDVNGT